MITLFSFANSLYSRWIKILLYTTAIVAIFLLLVITAHQIIFSNRIYPNIYFLDENIGLKTYDEAEEIILQKINNFYSEGLTLVHGNETKIIDPALLGLHIEGQTYVKESQTYARNGHFQKNMAQLFELFRTPHIIDIHLSPNDSIEYQTYVAGFEEEINIPPTNASLKVSYENIEITPSSTGESLDKEDLHQQIQTQLEQLESTPITISMTIQEPSIIEENISPLLEQAQYWSQQHIKLEHNNVIWEISPQELSSWIGTSNKEGSVHLTTNTDNARKSIWEKAEADLNRQPTNAELQIHENKAEVFTPSEAGLIIQTEETLQLLDKNLQENILTSQIKTAPIEPDITISQLNDLGISELVAQGVSYYTGSSAARIHNIRTGTKKLNGTIVMPGETFSFNQTVGDISAVAGFVEGLIIQGNKTAPGIGGGICQTSTTMFRAALDGGYPVIERNQHSYRVKYYEIPGEGFESGKPGIDAAIYSPIKDLQFLNDTDSAILIRTTMNEHKNQLIYELYSTPTGRTITLSEPKVYNLISAPAPVYIDTPDKPVGYLKQVDWAAQGATTEFTRTIEYPNGEITEEIFKTVYRPWSAKYERGTQGAEEEENQGEENKD